MGPCAKILASHWVTQETCEVFQVLGTMSGQNCLQLEGGPDSVIEMGLVKKTKCVVKSGSRDFAVYCDQTKKQWYRALEPVCLQPLPEEKIILNLMMLVQVEIVYRPLNNPI